MAGQTVVVVARLLAESGLDRSLATEAVSVTLPIAVGAMVKVTEAEELLLIVPRFPTRGLLRPPNTLVQKINEFCMGKWVLWGKFGNDKPFGFPLAAGTIAEQATASGKQN